MAQYIGAETAFGKRTSGYSVTVPRGQEHLLPFPMARRPVISYGGGGGGVAPEATSAIQRAIDYYSPEGGYGKGTEAALERGRTKAVASGAQSLVSAGLAGTTMMAGLGKKYEEEVAGPMRARVEETRAGAVSGLEMMKAQIIQGATEAQRSRALQTYLARLQSDTSLTASVMRQPTPTGAVQQPTAQPASTGTTQPAYKFPSAPSLVGGSGVPGRSPTAASYGSARFQS